MRTSRRLTASERWEVGFFLAMMVLAGVGITAVVNLRGLPRIFAFSASDTDVQNAETPSEPPAISLLDIGPPPPSEPVILYTGNPIADTRIPLTIGPGDAPRAKVAPKILTPEIKTYNGQQYRYVKTVQLRVTAYAPDPRCTYPFDGKTTASGMSVKTNGGKLVAADTSIIPMYSLVSVPGYAGGQAVPVLDRGGAIKGSRLDVMLPTYEKAKAWGSRLIDVKIYRPL